MWHVLVVEDDARTRAFFEDGVRRSDRLALAGSVATVAEACGVLDAPDRPVDVLLVDLGLPDGRGTDVIRHARRTRPACEALVISMFGDDVNVLASIEAGALGYIHKDVAPGDIAQTILDMKSGASPISPMIARRLLERFRGTAIESAPQPSDPDRPSLSRREQEVLALIARGFTYGEIARLQQVSVHTVQTHIKNLYGKLAVHSRSEAVFEATRMGLLPRHG